jgi:hypothetical protein
MKQKLRSPQHPKLQSTAYLEDKDEMFTNALRRIVLAMLL